MKNFVKIERQFIGSNPQFVSEIDKDVIHRVSGRSSNFSEMEHTLFIASNGSKNVARCAAMINRRYQKDNNEAVGFIGYFAAMPDHGLEVESMIRKAETWLKERGVNRIIAPYNGSPFLGYGLRTAGFDEEPVFPFTWQPPYYADYFVNAGYKPTYPLWSYTIDFASDKYRTAKQRATENKAVSVRAISKKNWRQDIETFRQLCNDTFKDEWEFHTFSRDEFHEFFDQLKPVLDTQQMLIGEVNGKAAGWCWGIPDLNPLFRSFNGKLGLIQIVKLMLKAGSYKRAGLICIGVLEGYKGNGLAHTLATTLYRRYEERGLKEAFYYPVNENNHRSKRFAESIGGTGRVLYHCYDKRI
ncbi:MAG TPA: GNAT family N-acetyltransferase [Bacteroidales bacterium]|nr:GNAT family N-acetyltransferase [Bacteroidales bacterium]